MKFTCVVTGVKIGTPTIWQRPFNNAAVPINLASELKLTIQIADAKGAAVLKIIDVCLEQSCIVSITTLHNQPPQELIVSVTQTPHSPFS